MKVNGGNVYAGIKEARGAGNTYQVKLTEEELKESRLSLHGDGTRPEKLMTLTGDRKLDISNRVELDMMRNTELNRELQQKHPDDPFWGNTGNQWLVFSEFLYNNGVYDDLSTGEAAGLDEALQKMTYGMDDVSRWQLANGKIEHEAPSGYLSGIGFSESSDAMRLELESSVEALKYFGEKYISDDKVREEFNGLIDTFYNHNTEILKDYQSAAQIRAAREASDAPEALNELLRKLGAGERYPYVPEHSDEEEEEYRTELTGLFQDLKEDPSGWKDVWNQMESIFLKYVMGQNSSAYAKDAVLLGAQKSFARMKEIWSGLLGVENAQERLNIII